MKLESAAFTAADVPHFLDEIAVYDVRNTADRLRRGSERLAEFAARVPDERAPEGADGWNAKEILAHIAVLSRAYGVFAYMVAKGRISELMFESVISQRDVVGEEMASKPVAEIVAEAQRQHQRTLDFLSSATLEELRRPCKTEGGEITPEELIRIPLVAHLEQHLEQLEAALPA